MSEALPSTVADLQILIDLRGQAFIESKRLKRIWSKKRHVRVLA
jgi:hypothetical protein